MKKYIVKPMLAAAAVLALAACDDNSWNEDYLDGFTTPDINTEDVKTVEYTLTDADYKAIAANKTNIALAGDELKEELENVGKLHRFTEAITPEEYLPAFLGSTSFDYFALSNGSAVKVTYNVAEEVPEELERMNAATAYTLTQADYQQAYGSEDNYAMALSPSNGLSNVPAMLAAQYPNAELGDYVVVNYNWSMTDPVFGTVPDDEKRDPISVELNVSADRNDADCKAFFQSIVDWVYQTQDVPLGSTSITSGVGYVTTYGNNEYWSGASSYQCNADIRGAKAKEQYAAGFPDMTDEQISELLHKRFVEQSIPYALGVKYTDLIEGDEFTVTYKTYDGTTAEHKASYEVNSDGDIVVKTSKPAAAPRRVATVASEGRSALYYYNGSNWSQPNNATALSAAQCNEMTGKTYGNLTTAQANALLPIFMKQNFPYAQANDREYVVFNNYEAKAYVARQYEFDGTEWAENDHIESATLQFVKQSTWKADPSVTITLPAGKNIEISSTYYQACSEWVYQNIDVPLGSTSITSGFGYVTSFGNNEYYSGTSAYQNNVDLRADKAKAQYPDGYEGMSDEEIVALMKKRFETEVMPGALAMLHPDAVPMEGVQVTYTITFSTYDYTGTNTYKIRFEVTAPGEFTFLDCTWNKAE